MPRKTKKKKKFSKRTVETVNFYKPVPKKIMKIIVRDNV